MPRITVIWRGALTRSKTSIKLHGYDKEKISKSEPGILEVLRYATSLEGIRKSALKGEKQSISSFREENEASELWESGKLLMHIVKVTQYLSMVAKSLGQQHLDNINAYLLWTPTTMENR